MENGDDDAAVHGAVRDARSRGEGASRFSADMVAAGGTPRVVEQGHTGHAFERFVYFVSTLDMLEMVNILYAKMFHLDGANKRQT
uniref:Uncharacterized protein n=1 Tax=Aegilops tauschii TaxID=37682 RepID=M8CP34_AEGTA